MMDLMCLAAQIVSCVGFLGAGVILNRHHDVISGRLQSQRLVIRHMRLGDLAQEDCYRLDIEARVDEKTQVPDVFAAWKGMKDVVSVKVEML